MMADNTLQFKWIVKITGGSEHPPSKFDVKRENVKRDDVKREKNTKSEARSTKQTQSTKKKIQKQRKGRQQLPFQSFGF